MQLENIRNWLISNFETVLTVFGFLLTLIELRRTKNSVEASRKATKETITLLSERSTISDIAIALAGLKEIQTALRGSRFETTLIKIQELRERLYTLRNRAGFKSEERLIKIQEIILSLQKMQEAVENNLSKPENYKIPIPRFNNKLAEHATQLANWREELHYTKRSDD